jgi:opacity protein-like surface antigen
VCLTLVVAAVSAQYGDANGYGGYGGGDAGHHHQEYYHVSRAFFMQIIHIN